MDWKDTLFKIAPTVATALVGPLGGLAISTIGSIFGMDNATEDHIKKVIEDGQLTPEHIAKLRELEMQYIENEKERGFKYSELVFKDRDSARSANVAGGIQKPLFVMSLLLLCLTLGTEVWVLFNGYPAIISDIIVGRVLGLMDAVAMMVLAYYYGTSSGSQQKTDILLNKP